MIPKSFEFNQKEDQIYQRWLDSKAFKPTPGKAKETFTIMMPPPNATGTLHMGHASMLAIQDIMIRFKRMQGYETLWLPGTDHAAIATQDKVENIQFQKTGKTRHDFGRDTFLQLVDEFVKESQATITNQTKKMGASCDWDQIKFTLDPELKEAVTEMFIRMYNDGLIYRGGRIVNWDPKMQTTVADDEVEYKEEFTNFYYFQFGPVVIGTSRPETKFLDDTIVVHPDDERYKHLIGKEFTHEWINGTITSKVIADESIDMELGTGAMTISPAHSLVDYEIAQKNNLKYEKVIGLDGKILESASKECAGMNLKEARKAVVEILKEKELVTYIQNNYKHNLAVNYRGGGVIEPQIMEQWFIDVNKPAVDWEGAKMSLKQVMQSVVRENKIQILPESQKNVYFNWIDKLQDWCISRQIWYGHRIPAWFNGQEIKVQKDSPGQEWTQDPDSLDTWFSSGMWTFSTLGWPNNTEMLKKFHPTDVLETGYDILFFWVARMILMTTYATGQVPFKTVYLHGLVRDKNGDKMSKSKGNGIDPLDVIQKYGTDAVRLSLFMGTRPGQDVRIFEEKIASFRNFITKIWNSARFAILNIDFTKLEDNQLDQSQLKVADKWILHETQEIIQETTKLLSEYRLSEAGNKIYDFLWNDFCSWYLEISKQHPNHEVLHYVLKQILKMLHPFVPFVTEELWSSIGNSNMLINEEWPVTSKELQFPNEKKQIVNLMKTITSIRSIMADFDIAKDSHITIQHKNIELLESTEKVIKHMGKVSKIEFSNDFNNLPKTISQVVSPDITILLHLDQNIDIDAEKSKMQTEIDNLNTYILSLEKKLSNKRYTEQAPAHIVDETKANLKTSQEKLSKITERLNALN
jgi:valyl-tRNA synthetase